MSIYIYIYIYIHLGQQLTSFDDKIVGQWRMYFGLKAKFYLAEVRIERKRFNFVYIRDVRHEHIKH